MKRKVALYGSLVFLTLLTEYAVWKSYCSFKKRKSVFDFTLRNKTHHFKYNLHKSEILYELGKPNSESAEYSTGRQILTYYEKTPFDRTRINFILKNDRLRNVIKID